MSIPATGWEGFPADLGGVLEPVRDRMGIACTMPIDKGPGRRLREVPGKNIPHD